MIRLNAFLSVVASGRPGSHISDPFDCDVYMVETEEGLVLSELRRGHTVEEIQAAVEPVLHVAPDLREMEE